MRRTAAAVLVMTIGLSACGKYGAPVLASAVEAEAAAAAESRAENGGAAASPSTSNPAPESDEAAP